MSVQAVVANSSHRLARNCGLGKRSAFNLLRYCLAGALATSAHHVEEFAVCLGGPHLFEHHLHGFDLIHVVQKLTQDAGFLQNLGL